MTEDKQTEPMMFKDCTEPVQDLLKDLSMFGCIYIGRTGVGLTTDFRKETFKTGTLKACCEMGRIKGNDAYRILFLIASEGPRWVPYKRVEEVYYGVTLPESMTRATTRQGEDHGN